MRTGITAVLLLLAVTFLAVGLPVLVGGAATPRSAALADLQRDLAPYRRDRDLAVAGTLMRNGGLHEQRLRGATYVPLLDADAARAVDAAGVWKRPDVAPGGRAVVARLSLDAIHASGLPWDETIERPGAVGGFAVRGSVHEGRRLEDDAQDLLWERFGLRPQDVLVVDHGVPSFGRGNAAVAVAIGALCLRFAWRRMRRRGAVVPDAEGTVPPGPGPAARSEGGRTGLLGGVLAAGLGLLAIFARVGDEIASAGTGLVRGVDAHLDDAARHAEPPSSGERALEAIATAKDVGEATQTVRAMSNRGGTGTFTIEGGSESYALRDGAWHLTATDLWIQADVGGRVEQRTIHHAAAPGEDATTVRFEQRSDGSIVARVRRPGPAAGEPTVELDLPLRAVVGDWRRLVEGGHAEFVCTAEGTAKVADAHAADLRERLAAVAAGRVVDVAVERARSPRFLVDRDRLTVEVGETRLVVRSSPAAR